MEWPIIAVLVLAVPIVILPLVFVWRLNLGGTYQAIREAGKQRAIHKEMAGPETVPKQPASALLLAEPSADEERCLR